MSNILATLYIEEIIELIIGPRVREPGNLKIDLFNSKIYNINIHGETI